MGDLLDEDFSLVEKNALYRCLERFRRGNRDKMFLAELSDKLKQAAATRFKDQLEIDQLEVADSRADPFIQLADLFTSSINRTLNSDPQNDNPKDKFANYFLNVIGMTSEHETEFREDDIVTYVRL